MSVMEERFRAVQQTVEQARAIEASLGVGAAALEALKPALIALASRSELFPPEDFAVPEGATARIYRLAEDADHRFALYASAGVPGKAVLPHNHTTWAVISGVYGEEHNVFYDRIDNRATPGEGKLRKTGELTVVRGNAVAFLPDDFHTIAVTGGEAALHLHLYGLSLEHLPERIQFESDEGGRYRVFPSAPRIRTPEATPQAVKAMLADGEELAILDVREGGVFARSHLLFASSLPLSRLELGIDRLVPRRTARVVVCDDDGGELAQRAAYRLFALGWKNIAVLKGGVAGWRAAGYELFSGVFVPSKAFGELAAHRGGRAQAPPRRQGGRGDPRQPPPRRVPRDEHSRRRRLPRRRARLSRLRPGAAPRDPRRRELRRTHAQHHRRPVAHQCGAAQPRRRAEGRHHGLAPRRLRAGARLRRYSTATLAGGPRQGARGGGARGRARRASPHRHGDPRALRGGGDAAHALPLRRAQPRGISGRASPGLALRPRRPARPGDRSIRGHAERPHRAGRQRRRACDDDGLVADPDGLGGRLCPRRGAAGRRARARPRAAPPRRRRAGRGDDRPRRGARDDRGRRGRRGRFRHQPRIPRRAYSRRLVRHPRAPLREPRQAAGGEDPGADLAGRCRRPLCRAGSRNPYQARASRARRWNRRVAGGGAAARGGPRASRRRDRGCLVPPLRPPRERRGGDARLP